MARRQAVLVTNIPAPYRESVHERVSAALDGKYHVVYCDQREENRLWTFRYGDYSRSFLKPRTIHFRGRYIHANPDVWTQLKRLDPDVVISGGYNPTFLLAFLWAQINRREHIALTEGNVEAEAHLTAGHRWVRRQVYRRSAALIGVSKRSLDLFRQYSSDEEKVFRSCYSVDNEIYRPLPLDSRQYDVMFAGQFIDRKMPLFFSEVVGEVRRRIGRCSALVIGDGPLKVEFLRSIETAGVNYHYPGFVQPDKLPQFYATTRVFLFPTRRDTWGIVANEACAAGVPVVTCDNAGCAHDLVLNGHNGYVLPLDVALWAEHVAKILKDKELWHSLSVNALRSVDEFTPQSAAMGIVDAIEYARSREAVSRSSVRANSLDRRGSDYSPVS